MFGFTAKITKRRILAAVLVILLPCLILLAVKINSVPKASINISAKTAQQRIEFLKQFGWECETSSETVKDTVIPSEFDSVYINYNELQLSQGFDLTEYKGQSVKIYTIKVLNYPENSEYVYASLTVYDDKIIAGDIHSTALGGFMHGLKSLDKN